MRAREKWAKVSWCTDDVRTIKGCEDWSDERCEEFLDRNEDNLQCAMIERGWSALEDLLRWEDTDVQTGNRH